MMEGQERDKMEKREEGLTYLLPNSRSTTAPYNVSADFSFER